MPAKTKQSTKPKPAKQATAKTPDKSANSSDNVPVDEAVESAETEHEISYSVATKFRANSLQNRKANYSLFVAEYKKHGLESVKGCGDAKKQTAKKLAKVLFRGMADKVELACVKAEDSSEETDYHVSAARKLNHAIRVEFHIPQFRNTETDGSQKRTVEVKATSDADDVLMFKVKGNTGAKVALAFDNFAGSVERYLRAMEEHAKREVTTGFTPEEIDQRKVG